MRPDGPLARLGLRIRPRFGWRGIGLSAVGRLGGWTLATGVIANLAFMALYRTAAIPTGARSDVPAGPGGPAPIAGTAVLAVSDARASGITGASGRGAAAVSGAGSADGSAACASGGKGVGAVREAMAGPAS